jgi:hypothetical protein
MRLRSARRNEDGCQIVEAAVTRRALSTRSCAGPTYVGAASLRRPTSNTTRRRADVFSASSRRTPGINAPWSSCLLAAGDMYSPTDTKGVEHSYKKNFTVERTFAILSMLWTLKH